MDAKWYRLAAYDSADRVDERRHVGGALPARPGKFRELMRRTAELHEQLAREWPRLAAEYREALPEVTSPETWEQTFRPWTEASGDAR